MLFLHLSDIHFKAGDVSRPDDPNLGLRDDLLKDVRLMRRRLDRDVDCILVSGDIAYAGQKEEYEFAFSWLAELCSASGCDIKCVFVVPGNHDVDRSASKSPMHVDARNKLRSVPIKDADKEISVWFQVASRNKAICDSPKTKYRTEIEIHRAVHTAGICKPNLPLHGEKLSQMVRC